MNINYICKKEAGQSMMKEIITPRFLQGRSTSAYVCTVCTSTANMYLAQSQGLITSFRECEKDLSSSHTHIYSSCTFQRPQRCTHPVYLAQGYSGTDTETKRQVISAVETVPRVKSDRHQWNTTVFQPGE